MAGNYPDVPAPRMAYDRDGTVGLKVNYTLGTNSQLTAGEMANMNDESNSSVMTISPSANSQQWGVVLVFPQLRDITGYTIFFELTQGGTIQGVETSTDTTNGIDGTWTNQGNYVNAGNTATATLMRTSITALSVAGIRGIRWLNSSGAGGARNVRSLQLFGAIAAGETPDRLRMWHPTLDEPLDDNTSSDGAFFDWGDIQRNTTSDKTFRIKNNSATLTANGIIVSQETLTDTSPTVNSQFTFSDGGAFAASIDIGNLAPGALSPIITKRFTRPSNATLSLWTSRTIANPTSWT